MQGLSLAKTISKAVEVYYLENGKNPTKFKDLAIMLPGEFEDVYDSQQHRNYTDVYLNDEGDVKLDLLASLLMALQPQQQKITLAKLCA